MYVWEVGRRGEEEEEGESRGPSFEERLSAR